MKIIDRIRRVHSLIQLVSQSVDLKKQGQKHVGLCPFHPEKIPSFTVDEDKQLFHCFGCGVGGDIFSFVMAKEKIGFSKAVKYLARQYRIKAG